MNESIFDDPSEIVRLVDIVDPRREAREEAREEYRVPNSMRILRNRIVVFERQQGDLASRRDVIMEDLEREAEKAICIQERLRNELIAVEERMDYVESGIREAYKMLRKVGVTYDGQNLRELPE